jgi:N6-adenosine-specific RNA methylase IME4
MGYYARSQHELCLLCTRGNFPPPAEHLRPPTLIVGANLPGKNAFEYARPHDNRHSSKPDRLLEMIEQAYPKYFGPETVDHPLAIELFARNHRPKWDGHGFEYFGRPQDANADLIRISNESDHEVRASTAMNATAFVAAAV